MQRASGRLMTGVVNRGLQPERRIPSRSAHLGLDAASQKGQIVEFDRVEDDGRTFATAAAQQAHPRPGGQDRIDSADAESQIRHGDAEQQPAHDVGQVRQAHDPLAHSGQQDGAEADGGPLRY